MFFAIHVTRVLTASSEPLRVSTQDDWGEADAFVVAPGGCVVELLVRCAA